MASFGLGRQQPQQQPQQQDTGTTSVNGSTNPVISTTTTSTMMIDSNTPWMAASEGNVRLLQESLRHLQLPITVSDDNGYTLLHAAASYNQLAVLTFLRDQLLSLSATTMTNNNNDNLNATDNQQQQWTASILSYINQRDNVDGDTALHYCDEIDSAKFLIESCHADPTIPNSNGHTPIQLKRTTLQDEYLAGDEDEQEDSEEEIESLKILIEYLASLPQQ